MVGTNRTPHCRFSEETPHHHQEEPLTWRQEGCELVEDLGVLLAPTVPHHTAHVQGEGLEESTSGQVMKLQDVLHVMEVAQDQEVGTDTSHPF